MSGASVSQFCQSCGRQYALRLKRGDLGFEQMTRLLRFCTTCRESVGVACCWNSEASACTRCLTDPALIHLRIRRTASVRTARGARFALGRLRNAVGALRELSQRDGELYRTGRLEPGIWNALWWEASELILECEGRRDEARLALVTVPRSVSREGDEEIAILADSVELETQRYVSGRKAVERFLRSSQTRRQPIPRLPPVLRTATVGLAAVIGLLLVVTAVRPDRIFSELATRPVASSGAGSSTEVGSVLGQRGSPSSVSVATPASHAVIASTDFNEDRMGPLERDPPVGEVIGETEVVAFPSPFDRSVLLQGMADSGLCVTADVLRPGEAAVTTDIYAKAPIRLGTVHFILVPGNGQPSAFQVPPDLLASLRPQRWYHLRATWAGANVVRVEISDDEGWIARFSVPRTSTTQRSGAPGACITATGVPATTWLLVDNVRLEQ